LSRKIQVLKKIDFLPFSYKFNKTESESE